MSRQTFFTTSSVSPRVNSVGLFAAVIRIAIISPSKKSKSNNLFSELSSLPMTGPLVKDRCGQPEIDCQVMKVK